MKIYSDPIDYHPLLWRGTQLSHKLDTLSTGHAALDEALPGNGWPTGAVTELVNATTGCGELSLLLPVLAQLSQKNHWVTMIDPPWIPYPSALHGRGLALEKLLLIYTQSRNESLWACEQVIRGIPGGAMLAWPAALSFSELRRLQLAAKNTQKTIFLFRDQKAAAATSPAALRLQLTADDGDLQIRVLKCRGQRPVSAIRLKKGPGSFFWHQTSHKQPTLKSKNEPDLIFTQALIPPLVSSSGSSKRSSSSSESPVVSFATSRIARPSL